MATVPDLEASRATPFHSHSDRVVSLALDPTGTSDGILRVGLVTGEAPYWLVRGGVG